MNKDLKRQAKEESRLDNEYTLKLTQREWTVIFNIMLAREYKIGDALIVANIVDKIHPFVAVATNISPESEAKQKEEAGKILKNLSGGPVGGNRKLVLEKN